MAKSMSARLKRWAASPFQNVIEHLRDSTAFAETVSFGIANMGRLALAEELFQELDKLCDPTAPPNQESQDRLEDLRRRSQAAREQLDNGLPLLHSQLSIGIWSVVEAAMDDFIVAWLCNVPESLLRDEFGRVRFTINEFEQLDRESRMQVVVEEFKRTIRSDSKLGVERFEALLKPIGLSGSVDENDRRDIFELSQMRNAILHRGSRADKKLKAACPWISAQPGEKIVLLREDSDRYVRAVTNYLKAVIHRVLQQEVAVEQAI